MGFRLFPGWKPGEIAWLVFCVAAMLGLSFYWHDSALSTIAGVTGVLYTVVAGKGKVSCYYFGLVQTPIYAWLAWQNRYYGDALLNIYYFVMMFPGIWYWKRNLRSDTDRGIVKTRLPTGSRLRWAAVLAVCSAAGYLALRAYGGNRPLHDSLTNVLSVAAMILTVRRCIEQWYLWIVVNAVEVYMWWSVFRADGNDLSILVMWLLFLVNGMVLYLAWRRDMTDAARGPREA